MVTLVYVSCNMLVLSTNANVNKVYHGVCVLSPKKVLPMHSLAAASWPRLSNGAEVACVLNFLLCIRWAHPSICKSKRE